MGAADGLARVAILAVDVGSDDVAQHAAQVAFFHGCSVRVTRAGGHSRRLPSSRIALPIARSLLLDQAASPGPRRPRRAPGRKSTLAAGILSDVRHGVTSGFSGAPGIRPACRGRAAPGSGVGDRAFDSPPSESPSSRPLRGARRAPSGRRDAGAPRCAPCWRWRVSDAACAATSGFLERRASGRHAEGVSPPAVVVSR